MFVAGHVCSGVTYDWIRSSYNTWAVHIAWYMCHMTDDRCRVCACNYPVDKYDGHYHICGVGVIFWIPPSKLFENQSLLYHHIDQLLQYYWAITKHHYQLTQSHFSVPLVCRQHSDNHKLVVAWRKQFHLEAYVASEKCCIHCILSTPSRG